MRPVFTRVLKFTIITSLLIFANTSFAQHPLDKDLTTAVKNYVADKYRNTSHRDSIRSILRQRSSQPDNKGQSKSTGAVKDGVWTGRLEEMVVDLVDAEGNLTGSRREFVLSMQNDAKRLLIINNFPENAKANSVVEITGVSVNDYIIPDQLLLLDDHHLAEAGGANESVAGDSCAPIGPSKAITIAVNWQDDTTESPPVSTIDDRYFGANDSLAGYWDEASYGAMQLTGDTLGWYTLDIQSSEACNIGLVRQKALEAAAADTDLSQYNRIFIVMRSPVDGCGWAGVAYLQCSNVPTPDGTIYASSHWNIASYFNNPVRAVGLAAHEAGHNISLHHAGVRDYGSVSIGPVGDTSGSSYTEYGDRYDTMGNTLKPGHYNAIHKYNLGWLDDSNIIDMNTQGNATLDPMSNPISSNKAIRVYRGTDRSNLEKEYLWLETKQPIGYDAYIDTRGHGNIIVHHQHVGTAAKTENVDIHPGTDTGSNDYFDAPLTLGESFTDPYTSITITHNGIDALGNVSVALTQDPALADVDEDGLTATEESTYGTSPTLYDSDNDSLSDLREICFDGDCDTYNPWPTGGDLNPLIADVDGDGLDDGLELNQYNSDPLSIDTDGDGIEDGVEVNTYQTDPARSDTDRDGLTDYEEIFEHNTDPLDYDTDGDGVADGYEVTIGSNPNDASDPSGVDWAGTVTGRVMTSEGKGVAGVTFWDVSKFPEKVTTDSNGYYVIKGYLPGDTVWINTFSAYGYSLSASGWNGATFTHDGGAAVGKNYITTLKAGTVSGRITNSIGEGLGGITFWDVSKYPENITTNSDGSFVAEGYANSDFVWFNMNGTSSGYTFAASGWNGLQFQHDGSAESGFDYVGTINQGTLSGKITTPDGKPVPGLTFWDVSHYPDTETSLSDGSYVIDGYTAGDFVWLNMFTASNGTGFTLTPSNWNGSTFTHDGSAMQWRDFIAVPTAE